MPPSRRPARRSAVRGTGAAALAGAAALGALGALGAPGGAGAAPRTVLAELFGRPDCPECSDTRSALGALAAGSGERLVWVEYHDGAALGNGGSDARADAYGVSSRPEARFDGVISVSGAADPVPDYRAAYEARRDLPAPLEVAALLLFEGESLLGTAIVGIQVPAGETVPAPETASVRVVILEDPAVWCCGSGGAAQWPRTARLVLPPVPLTAINAGEEQSFELDFPMDPAWDVARLGGVVFVQRDSDLSVVAAAEGDVAGALNPLPVSFFDATVVNLFPNAPNPTRGRTQIDFFLPRADDASLRILDVRGREVRVLTDGPRTQGFHPILWDGTDWTGRPVAAGMYLYVLETSETRLARRLALVR